jgi:hypothetical protein
MKNMTRSSQIISTATAICFFSSVMNRRYESCTPIRITRCLYHTQRRDIFIDDRVGAVVKETRRYHMKPLNTIIGLLMLAGVLAVPAAAFTVQSLEVTIEENGDARMALDYSLSWVERAVVFMRIAHPDQQLERALESYTGKQVEVTSVTPHQTKLLVEGFARITPDPEGNIYTTPSMDFSLAEQEAKGYWFSRFVTVDASPEVTVIAFPDGYQEIFYDVAYIPGVTHRTGD